MSNLFIEVIYLQLQVAFLREHIKLDDIHLFLVLLDQQVYLFQYQIKQFILFVVEDDPFFGLNFKLLVVWLLIILIEGQNLSWRVPFTDAAAELIHDDVFHLLTG